ncbi:zinc-binding dehydrogenase [Kutzneria sp. NPDC052558]|uniref:zinc-binding dehydrogenase n=1 Tax=Kutzneria sp. NPDC052558 TaxID=3364121 RepID=UPI0037C5CA3F
MRAVRIDRFGPPEVLAPVIVEDPAPGPGEVLVDVEYAGITFVETQLRAGKPPVEAMLPALPAVLGNGVAGVVAAVGPDVDRAVIGKRVTASLNGSGGYAERAVAQARRLIDVPDGVGLDQAAALIADGRTALAVLGAAGDLAGATVLVEAAAGGVGSLLVQLASAAGARVVAAASGAAKLAVAAELGAEVTVDYSNPSWAEGIGRVDVVFDGVGGTIGEQALSLLRPDGTFCPYGAAAGSGVLRSDRPDVRTATTGMLDVARQVALAGEAIALAASGRLRATVGQVFALADAANAHRAIENRATIGKTLLKP